MVVLGQSVLVALGLVDDVLLGGSEFVLDLAVVVQFVLVSLDGLVVLVPVSLQVILFQVLFVFVV